MPQGSVRHAFGVKQIFSLFTYQRLWQQAEQARLHHVNGDLGDVVFLEP
jgi:hypothetical protein